MSDRNKYQSFFKGMRDAIPIMLGYLAVGFTMGICAKNAGFSPFQAFLSSFTQNASAGQFAGYTLIAAGASYLEVAVMILVANARYLLMSCAMSQKISPDTPLMHRMLIAYDLTDEIFGLSVAQPGFVEPFYAYGMAASAIPGWSLGTLFGLIAGNILPENIVTALSAGLFGMFIAVIVPPARKNPVIALLILFSMAASFIFSRVCDLGLSAGTRTIMLTVVISLAAAFIFPLKEECRDDA
ncbi:MAG: AzlC family ABC transporter permease [Synergistes sp.]|nr:AzlC family ABC transporter permease [Synergistes sp.]